MIAAPESFVTAGGILLLGFLFGLKHATEADHIAAVGAIVSEKRGWRPAALTGALWGAGHTLSIVVAGLCVLALRVAIPDGLARLFELVVALMIVGLGGTALARALRSRSDVHVHAHTCRRTARSRRRRTAAAITRRAAPDSSRSSSAWCTVSPARRH